jgi:hypothetical protein
MSKRPVPRTTRKSAPRDTDGDGLSDVQERRLGTNPRSRDTDHDGMPDDMEVQWRPATDPLRKDTDGDGLSDWAELMIGTNPTNPDTDEDGWFDGYEVGKGSDPTLATSGPPDGDGLSGDLLRAMQAAAQTIHGEPDADHDGLSDEFERRLGTNPKLPDTDNDGLGDMVEWLRGSNPKSPGRIDPQSNFDLNRVETGKPLPANERRDDPRYGPLGPKTSGKRADADTGDDDGAADVATTDVATADVATTDAATAATGGADDADLLLGAGPDLTSDDVAPTAPDADADADTDPAPAVVADDDVALAALDPVDATSDTATDTTTDVVAAVPDEPALAADDGLADVAVDDTCESDDALA